MERLTERHTFEIRGLNGEKYNQSCIVLKATGQPAGNDKIEEVYDKLANFEDFMEEQNIKDLELLKSIIDLGKKDRQTMQKYVVMWDKLKEFVIGEAKLDLENFNLTKNYMYDSFYVSDQTILDKMKELEKGE